MAFPNGKAPLTQLRTVSPGIMLLNPTAAAFKNLALVARMWNGTHVEPASHYGAGYRDLATQLVFFNASRGDKAAAAKADLDPNSIIRVASPGYSTHGWATRIDMLFNGRSPDAEELTLAARYGFTREFGGADPNHFIHDARTATSGVAGFDKIALTARFLNAQHYGRTTNASHTGQRDDDFIWLVQHHGHLVRSYPVHCVEDGKTGHYTEASFDQTWNTLKAG